MIEENREPPADKKPEEIEAASGASVPPAGKPRSRARARGRSAPPAPRGRRGRPPRRAAERFARGRISISDILGGTFSMYFGGFIIFTGVVALMMSPYIFIEGVVTLGGSAEPTVPEFVRQLLSLVLGHLAAGAVIFGVFRRVKRERIDAARCITIALGRVVQLVLVGLLTSLAAGVPAIIVIVGCSAISPMFGMTFGLILGGFVFATIFVQFFVAPAVVVVERLGVFASMGRSRRLTRGNRLRVFLIYLLLYILYLLIAWVSGRVVGLSLQSVQRETLNLAVYLLTQVLIVVYTAMQAVAVGLVYYRLKVQVEGADEDDLAAVFD